MTLTAASLFAGVGGFDLAMERAGIDVVATVEIDKAARGVLARRWPDRAHFGDIMEVRGDDLRRAGFVPDRGVLTGGFPCQDLSVAGRRAGLRGGRSGLFWEIARLADELRPRWLVLENVPGLLSSNGGRDMGTVLGALADLGYGWAYRVLDAQYFGLAQRRKRVFIVGCLGDDGRTPGEVLALREGVRGDPAPGRETREEIAATLGGGSGSRGWAPDTDRMTFVKVIRSGARDENGELPPEVWAERDTAPTLNVMDNTGDSRATVVVPTLLTMREGKDGGRKGPLVSEDQSLTLATGNGQVLFSRSAAVRGREGGAQAEMADEPTANALRAGDGGSSRSNLAYIESERAVAVRRLTPVECERLQGFPDGWTAEGVNGPQSDSARYRQMGNAVAVPVVSWIMDRLVKEDARG